MFNQVAAESPTGFIPGQVVFNLEPVQPGVFIFGTNNSMITLDGLLSPSTSDGNVPGGTRVKIYSQAGLHTESVVDQSGYFSFTLTDMIPGQVPFLLVFSSPTFDGVKCGQFGANDSSGLILWVVNEWIDIETEPNVRSVQTSFGSCPPDKYPWWCSYWLCNERHILDSWKLYNSITTMETRNDFLLVIYVAFAPF